MTRGNIVGDGVTPPMGGWKATRRGLLFVFAVLVATAWPLAAVVGWFFGPDVIIDRDGWAITQPVTMCAAGADPRYYYPKYDAVSGLICFGVLACVLPFCWHLWRVSTASRGLRVLAAVICLIVGCGALLSLGQLGIDSYRGFIGFVPHCPPG